MSVTDTAHTGTSADHRLGPVTDIPLGEGRAFAIAGEQVAVFRLRDGTLRATSAVCPHRGGPLADGQIDDRVVLCPLHLNAFDLATGECVTAAYALRTYPVRADGSDVVVTLP